MTSFDIFEQDLSVLKQNALKYEFLDQSIKDSVEEQILIGLSILFQMIIPKEHLI